MSRFLRCQKVINFRILLVQSLLNNPDILLLDESTNHLDIESREALKKSLIDFDGTVILVTYDRNYCSFP
ncbi:ABC transporter ATP-binding protein-like protein [Rickettsia conorii str. Malish 7]|uniref:ABC transporter ATP-binding protein-like protein n=1 Tax=Rickettsia conorii (strain ATCC VR-613 / Malish 7) TaxID=272944 RepID=Q92IK6_RICCN|nr:ABC transporter ATP-binding protein-like protein [Rickettsia conorii str. Malish 7]